MSSDPSEPSDPTGDPTGAPTGAPFLSPALPVPPPMREGIGQDRPPPGPPHTQDGPEGIESTSAKPTALFLKVLASSLLYLLLVLVSITLSRMSSGVALLWFANGFGLVMLLRSPRRDWGALLLAMGLANLSANLLHGDPLELSGVLALANVLEIGVSAHLTVRFVKLWTWPPKFEALNAAMLINLLVAIPVGGLMGSSGLWLLAGLPWLDNLYYWCVGSILGALQITLPALLYSRQALETLKSPRQLLSFGGLLLLLLLCLVLILDIFHFPFILLAMPITVVAFIRGAFQAALLTDFAFLLVMLGRYLGLIPVAAALETVAPWQLWLNVALVHLLPMLTAVLVNELRQRAQALERSEARLASALQFAETGFALADVRGSFRQVNDYVCDMLGYDRNTLLNMPFPDLLDPDDRPQVLSRLTALQGGRCDTLPLELRYQHRDGHLVWGRTNLSRLETSDPASYELMIQLEDVSERRARELQIVSLSERLSLASRAIGMGVWVLDLKTNELQLDEQMKQLYWLDLQDNIASRDLFVQRVNPDDRIRTLAKLEKAIEARTGFSDEVLLIGPNGQQRIVSVTAVVKCDDRGRPTSVIGINLDVSERKAMAAEIVKARDQLQRTLDYLPAFVGYWDAEQRNQFANLAYRTQLRLDPEQLKGKTMLEAFGPQAYAVRKPHVEAALRGEEQLFEQLVAWPDEPPRWCLIRYSPHRVNGEVQGFFTIVTDIASLRKAQEQQLLAQTRFQSVIDAASEFAILALDPSGLIRLFSPGAERMLGYSAAEMENVATPAVLHVAAEIEARARELTEELGYPVSGLGVFVAKVREGGVDAHEWHYRHKDGHLIPVQLVVTAMRGAGGRIYGFLGIAKDITIERQQQQTLSRALEQAEQASRLKSQFLANMSHEIRTPMNAVLGMVHLLSDTSLTVEQRKYLNMLKNSGQALLAILNDILDFSKIEAGHLEIVAGPFSLDDLLESVSSLMVMNARGKALELVVTVGPRVPRALIGDALRLQQVLVNIAGNAIKFTSEGEVLVSVAVMSQNSSTVVLRFSVRDTGIGMTPEEQGRLFQAFSQVDGSISRRFGGTGLGLTISKQLVGLMKGELGVHSQPGEGSEFWFTLPLALDPAQPAPEPLPQLEGLRVLVIDDNPHVCAFLCELLNDWGGHGDAVASGAEALSRLSQADAGTAPYNIVLLDWNLATRKGGILLTSLRATGPEGLAIIALEATPGRREPDAPSILALADAVVQKPVTARSLLEALEQVLHRQESPQKTLYPPLEVLEEGPSLPSLPNLGLLLVEDNRINQVLAQRILERAGATVDVAQNGAEAIEMLRAQPHRYQLVLMDIQMPVMDGLTASRTIRQELKLTLPILAMTAGVFQAEREQYRAVGINDVIAKPIDVSQMLSLIAHHALLVSRPTQGPATPLSVTEQVFAVDELRQVVGEDKPVLISLVRQFVTGNLDLQTSLQQGLQPDTLAEVARKVHSVRGTAGTFAASALARTGEALEVGLRASPMPPLAPLVQAFQQAQAATLSAAQAWLATHDVPLAPELPAQLSLDALSELIQALACHDLDACNLYTTLRPGLLNLLEPDTLQQLDQAVDALLFEPAVSYLQPLLDRLTDASGGSGEA